MEVARRPRPTRAGSRPRSRARRRRGRRRRRAGRSGPRAAQASVARASGARPSSARSRGPPTATARPSTVARAPRPASASKSVAAAGCDPARVGRLDDRPGERVLRVGLDRRREPEQPRLVDRRPQRRPRATGWPFVSVPVLSKMTTSSSRARSSAIRSLTSRPFRAPSEVEIAMTSGIARPRACGQAMTSTVAVRTSAPFRVALQPPEDERDAPGGERDVEQDRGGAVGERLGPRRRRLGRRDHPHDPRQRRLLADGGHPDAQAAAGGDRAGDDLVARLLRHRPRLAGDHRLVDVGRPSTTMPSAGTRAPGRTRTTSPTARAASGTVSVPSPVDPLGGVRQELGEGRQGAARLGDRAHLEPVAEEHDRDEGRELPPDLDLEQAERAGPGRDEGDDDRERDEGHHPGLAVGAARPGPPRRKTRPPYRKTIVPRTGGMSAEPGNVGAV